MVSFSRQGLQYRCRKVTKSFILINRVDRQLRCVVDGLEPGALYTFVKTAVHFSTLFEQSNREINVSVQQTQGYKIRMVFVTPC